MILTLSCPATNPIILTWIVPPAKILCNYTGSRSLSLSKTKVGCANRFDFDKPFDKLKNRLAAAVHKF